jgi:hypothetical protein
VDRSAELRVPTLAVAVRLAIVGREPEAVELFVADVARRGRSHLLDDLAAVADGPEGFLPVRSVGAVRLLAKHAIAWIGIRRRTGDERPPTEFPEELSDVLTLSDRQHRVAIELIGGAVIEGLLLDSSPAHRPRVMDHLNRSGRFLRVWTPDEHILVAKPQIVAVAEQGMAEPTPLG